MAGRWKILPDRGPSTSNPKLPLCPFSTSSQMAFRTTANRQSSVIQPKFNNTAVLPLQYDSLVALVDLARLRA